VSCLCCYFLHALLFPACASNSSLQAQVLALQNELATLRNASLATAPHRAPAAPFSGDRQGLRGFVNQCRLLFQVCPDAYPTERNRVALMVSLLSGPALTWVSPLLEANHPMLWNLALFIKALTDMFGDADRVERERERERERDDGGMINGQGR
uniref:DUF4939 domain-containing protein n=1 Tax=Varanus komodoensis TaxID=61221 RepID=A0A8D2IZI9_VARKO